MTTRSLPGRTKVVRILAAEPAFADDGGHRIAPVCRVHFDSWAGRFSVRAAVLAKVTRAGRDHYKVRFLEPAMRRFGVGSIGYPPCASVTF